MVEAYYIIEILSNSAIEQLAIYLLGEFLISVIPYCGGRFGYSHPDTLVQPEAVQNGLLSAYPFFEEYTVAEPEAESAEVQVVTGGEVAVSPAAGTGICTTIL